MAFRYLVPARLIGNAAILSAALFVASCATHPDKIAPVSYAGDDCTTEDRARLAHLVAEQTRTANADRMGVAMIGLPVSSISGKEDHSAEIARLKGACGSA